MRNQGPPPAFAGDLLFRYFSEYSHAEALQEGNVWITTLATCRTIDNSFQGDPGEATEKYTTGTISGGSDNTDFRRIAERVGIRIGPGCSNGRISDGTAHTRLPDAYILCFTERRFSGALINDFGRHCVEIAKPSEFYRILSEKFKSQGLQANPAFGRVIYKKREYTGLNEKPGPIGFVKPPDLYLDQQEIRMLWAPKDSSTIEPRLIKTPELAHLCRIVA